MSLCSGCVAATGLFGQTDDGSVMPVFVEQGFDRYLSVEKGEIAVNQEIGLKHAKVWLKNVGERPLRIVYSYCWYDVNGNLLEQSGFVEGRQPLDCGISKLQRQDSSLCCFQDAWQGRTESIGCQVLLARRDGEGRQHP